MNVRAFGYLDIGGQAVVSIDDISALVTYKGHSMTKLRNIFKKNNKLIKTNEEFKGKSMIITRSGYLYVSRFRLGTLVRRLSRTVALMKFQENE